MLVFGIFPSKTATISGLTIRNAEAGAGVWNEQGTLTVSDCAVTSNSYQGLYNHEGTLNVNNCVLSGNSGAGLSNYGVAAVSSCVLTGNSYVGLNSYAGETTVSNCVVSGNSSGGLVNDGPHNGPSLPNGPVGSPGSMTIADSMISDNSGPGVSNVAGFLTVLDSTLSGNPAGQALDGGGIMSGPLFENPVWLNPHQTSLSAGFFASGCPVSLSRVAIGAGPSSTARSAATRLEVRAAASPAPGCRFPIALSAETSQPIPTMAPVAEYLPTL